MKQKKLISFILFSCCLPLYAQTYSLKHCVDYAIKNNSNIKIAYLDSDISNMAVKEQIGTGLPQIEINGSLDDKLKMPTSMMPGALIGKPGTTIPVQMGVKYNASGTLTLNQKLFSPSFWIALKAAKISDTLSAQDLRKTSEQTMYDVSTAYCRASIIQKQLENLKLILRASGQTLKSTELRFKNGLAKKIDVDKIRVSYNNTNTNVQQTELRYNQALNNLKFAMGMPVDGSIVLPAELPDSSDYVAGNTENVNPLDHRIEYQMKKTNIRVYELTRQNYMAAYLPTLSFYANYGLQAMRNEFNLFNSDHWYGNSSVGLNLAVPIFSGFSRLARVEQSQINIEKAKESLKLTEQSIKTELSNAFIGYSNALDNIKTQKENLSLAESVYKNTQLDFSQGAGSSIDVVQTESSLRETQNNYYSQLLNLYIAKLDLEKSKGTLSNFINNLK